jgi:transcriptional regulator with XRE-family HTH domain
VPYGLGMSTEVVLATLAQRLRSGREDRGLTLDELATATGLSKPYLSRLESGDRQPSVATLLTVSRALGVPTSALLGEGPATASLAVYDAQPGRSVNGLDVAPYSGFAGSRGLEALRITIDPDRRPPSFACHRGEEWVYILAGVLRLEYDVEQHLLGAGQAAHFDASRPHRLGAHGGPVQVLLVGADSPTDMRREHS